MNLKNIFVHIDAGERVAARLGLAVALAQRDSARLTGLFAQTAQANRVGLVASWPSEAYRSAFATARAAFTGATAELGDRAALIDVNRGGDQEILARTVEIVRASDLVILGQPEQSSPVPADLPERVIMEAGRPALVVPYAGDFPDLGARPLFAWRQSRGAARALNDALPLLKPGADGLVVCGRGPKEPPGEFDDLPVKHLAAHGFAARFQAVVVDEVGAMDMVLNQAADHGADLIALGAFDGHGLIGRGAGARHILRHMTAPVLFSH